MANPWEPQLEALMTSRYSALSARARVLGVSSLDVDDLVQAALVKTFAKPRNFRTTADAEAYVKRVIVTVFLDEYKRHGDEQSRWQRATAAAPRAVHDPVPTLAVQIDMERALALLSPRERACVVLRYLEDLTINQTASHLGLSTGAVKRYVHDGLAQLNTVLGTTASTSDPHTSPVIATEGSH